jgi:hypothetical protein
MKVPFKGISSIMEFASAVIRHWKTFITSSIIAALLWWLQGVGWLAPH